MPFFILSLVFLFAGSLRAESALKPVSVSYENIVHCYSELSSDKISSKVDLGALKDLIDRKFVSTESWLRYRKVRYKKENGQVQQLTQGLKKETPRTYELRLEKWDEKDGFREVSLSQAQRINPSPKQIESFFLDASVQSDDSAYESSRAHGLEMSWVKGLQGVQSLELRDRSHGKSLSCNQEKDLGVICTCSKK